MSDAASKDHLRERLSRSRRRIAEQHAGLDAMQVDVQRALDDGNGSAIEDALRALSGAVEAHFELEERAYYPDRASIDADVAARLDDLESDHEQLRAELDELRAAVVAGDVPALRSLFSVFAVLLATHEAEEEKVMAELADRG